MAFRFQWPYFSDEFIQEAKTMLTNALNKGNKPAVIVDHITVKELDMGTLPPELEMLEMGELSMERFRGIFKLTYNGDAHIVLQTKVQANPMNVKKTDNPSYTRRGILAADQPLVVPMLLRISDFKLRGIIVLVVDQIKGITLVFKNDPLESVLVSSTFDSITPIQRFLQSEIEKQLRNLFQEDLPTAIHNLSQQFTKRPEEISRQHSQDEIYGRAGIYDGGLGTPMVSRNPSRRASMQSSRKKVPGKTSSEPDLSMGTHYDQEGLKIAPKSTRSTVRSESPDSDPRRDPHTDYHPDAQRDLLQESLSHPANNPNLGRSSSSSSRRTSRRPSSSSHTTDHHEHTGASTFSTMERLSLRDNPIQPSLGIAESTHLANQFANLIHSNQTISPYAQNLEHFAFRSVPPKRPTSLQYLGSYRAESPGSKSGPNSLNGSEVSKDGLGAIKNSGQPNGYRQYRSDTGYGQNSPKISHRRLQGRVGIRRYAMQMGAGGGPRELSDHDSDEYNDVNEALSENEYVYVEKLPRPSLDSEHGERHRDRDHQGQTASSRNNKPSAPYSLTSTTTHTAGKSSDARRPSINHRQPSSPQRSYHSSASGALNTMPGGFSDGVDPQTWSKSSSTDSNARTETHPTSLKPSVLSSREGLHRGIAAMQLGGGNRHVLSSSPSSPPMSSFSSLAAPFSSSQSNEVGSTTARSFSNTQQRHNTQLSPRLPPPEALKRDKRNSSILSSRRVSSVGIGLGVLSKEGEKKGVTSRVISSQQHQHQHHHRDQQQEQGQDQDRLTRPSLYKNKPFMAYSDGWLDPDSS
ncbi:ERMES complex subunit [Lobosporangium transversale]|nr:ERMES complex subunit [Lobosporangium transversale]